MKAFILAAGLGTRLRGLDLGVPKVMVPIDGRPLLEHHFDLLARHGIRELIVNLHHLPEVIVEHCGDGRRFGVTIDYSHETSLLGTAGAVKKMEGALRDDTFLVLYGDNLVRAELGPLLDFHRRSRALVTIALCASMEPWTGGVVEADAAGRVHRFLEKPPSSGALRTQLINAGIIVAEPALLPEISEGAFCDFGTDLFPKLLADGRRVFAMVLDGYVQDIGTPERLEKARRAVESGLT